MTELPQTPFNSPDKPCLNTNCPGCSLWQTPYELQLQNKTEHLSKNLNFPLEQITVTSAGSSQIRDRIDFILIEQTYGLIDSNRQFIEIDDCLQINELLNEGFQKLKKSSLRSKKGSLRLRNYFGNHPQKKWGLWLDFSNLEIKFLLEEKKTLFELDKYFFLEIGQKRKTVLFTESALNSTTPLKLAAPLADFWFKAPLKLNSDETFPIYGFISGFTQPSVLSARLLNLIISRMLKLIKLSETATIVEFGSGLGQYSLMLLEKNYNLNLFEVDELAIQCFEKTLKYYNIQNKPILHLGDFQKKNFQSCESSKLKPELIIVNPPKSGLMNFIETIQNFRAKHLLYISCYPYSLSEDVKKMQSFGYQIKDVFLVDQFPQTAHYESVVYLTYEE